MLATRRMRNISFDAIKLLSIFLGHSKAISAIMQNYLSKNKEKALPFCWQFNFSFKLEGKENENKIDLISIIKFII